MRRIGWILVGLAAMASDPAKASPFDSFTVQGVLRNNNTLFQSVSVSVTVWFYATETGGQALAGPMSADVPVTNGLFSLTISDPQLIGKLSGTAEVWMAVNVLDPSFGTFPRQKITSQLFALMAKQADGLSSACSGCVSDSMLATGISGSKLSGSVSGSLISGSGTVNGNVLTSGTVAPGALSGPANDSNSLGGTTASGWVKTIAGTSPISASATANSAVTISLGTVPIANGGTGITTVPAAAGQYLRSTAANTWGISTIFADIISGATTGGGDVAFSSASGGFATRVANLLGAPVTVAASSPATNSILVVGNTGAWTTGTVGNLLPSGTNGQFMKYSNGWAAANITTSDVSGLSTSYVDLASSQSISGSKAFTGGATISGTNLNVSGGASLVVTGTGTISASTAVSIAGGPYMNSSGFTGNGANISSLNASNISSGTLDVANRVADLAITGAKIADANISEAKLATGAVTTTKIADNAVTSAKIGAGQVGATQIADASLTAAKVRTGQGIVSSGTGPDMYQADSTHTIICDTFTCTCTDGGQPVTSPFTIESTCNGAADILITGGCLSSYQWASTSLSYPTLGAPNKWACVFNGGGGCGTSYTYTTRAICYKHP